MNAHQPDNPEGLGRRDDARHPQVPRTTVLAWVESTLRLLKKTADTSAQPIINLHGIAGLGKSHILRQIFERYKDEYAVFLLDFNLDQPVPSGDILPWSEVITRLKARLPVLEKLPDTITLAHDTLPTTDVAVIYEATAVKRSPPRSTILLLDDLDDLAYWKWIQEQIIKPLLDQQQSALVVCASQSPLFWHFWELREQCTLDEAPAFSLEETDEFLGQHGQYLLTRELYALTRGYPLGLKRALALIARESAGTAEALAVAGISQKLAPETWTLVTYVGLLRWVQAPVMERLLNQILPDWAAKDQPQSQFFALLGELRTYGYLEPLRKSQPLRFVPAFRRAVEVWLREEHPERYRTICTRLAEIYYQRFYEKPIDEPRTFNEWLFFSAVALGEAAEDEREAWKRKLEQLTERARLVGEPIIIDILRDSELIERLRSVGQAEAVQRLLGARVAEGGLSLPILSAAEVEEYQYEVLEYLKARLPAERLAPEIQALIDYLLRSMVGMNDEFSVAELRERLSRGITAQLKPGHIIEALTLFNSRGFLSYASTRRKYRVQALIKYLLAGAADALSAGSSAGPLLPGSTSQ